jgi:RHS repeat-associated protein
VTHSTGKERDFESGLDMFGVRYYGSSLGRFMTPDWTAKPTPVPYAHYGNPQSLNLYSYVNTPPQQPPIRTVMKLTLLGRTKKSSRNSNASPPTPLKPTRTG